MKVKNKIARNLLAFSSLAGVAVAMSGAVPAVAMTEEELVVMPEPSNDYTPSKTEWGDPDFRGMWPIDNIASIPMQRPPQYGDRFWLNDEEYAERMEMSGMFDERYEEEDKSGTIGMGHWVESGAGSRRTSLLIEPADGQIPAMTPEAQKLYQEGRSSWNQHPFDWTDDFDTWDRCITRGFPASMFPFRYNNGIQVLQAPGKVVINLEMIHDSRVVNVVPKDQWEELQKTRWPEEVRTWMGQSLGYWEDDNTLVIETTNIKAGDSVTEDTQKRGPSPFNMATLGVPPNNTIPTSMKAKVVEKLHMVGPDTIIYELTYSDPEVFTAPWKARLDWTRNPEYSFFEYACHEGNVQVRNYINASRAERGLSTSKVGTQSGNTAPEDVYAGGE